MNAFYFILGFIGGVGAMMAMVLWITLFYKNSAEVTVEPPVMAEPDVSSMAPQFVDPEPLKDKLKDGMTLTEITQ